MSIFILLIKCSSVNTSGKKKGDYCPLTATQDITRKTIKGKLMRKNIN